MWSFNVKDYIYFDNETNIHLGYENYEENDYGHDLDLLIILH